MIRRRAATAPASGREVCGGAESDHHPATEPVFGKPECGLPEFVHMQRHGKNLDLERLLSTDEIYIETDYRIISGTMAKRGSTTVPPGRSRFSALFRILTKRYRAGLFD